MRTAEAAALRVLVLAPIGRDSAASADLLRRDGLTAEIVGDVDALVRQLENGAGAVFVAEEALFGADLTTLEFWVRGQSAWSDLPFVVLTSHLDQPKIKLWRQQLVDHLQNVSLLERPVQPITLTSALQVALRARRHQLEVRSLLEEQQETAQKLEALVIARTRQLEDANTQLVDQMTERERAENFCANRRRWKPSASSPVVSLTTLTISLQESAAASN